MLTKSQIKYIKSLHQKKFRETEGAFIVEGEKMVQELLHAGQEIVLIAATSLWKGYSGPLLHEIDDSTLAQISALQTPNKVLAVVKKQTIQPDYAADRVLLFLDNIKDPGNLGTLIRSAEWFGLHHIFISPTSVEEYNPKTVQATMGSFFRTQVHRMSLEELLQHSGVKNVYGATLHGQNVRDLALKDSAVLVIGSESHGISEENIPFLSEQILIPRIGAAESLNASVAGSILLYEFAMQLTLS